MSSLLGRRLMIDLVALAYDCDPATVAIGRTATGQPVVTSAPHLGARVNASHAGEWVAAAVSTYGQIGIDLEVERPVPAGLPERCCAPSESDWLRRGTTADMATRFFHLWTLKEAFLKATGQGLGVDPRSLTFDISENLPSSTSLIPSRAAPLQSIPLILRALTMTLCNLHFPF